MAEAETRQIPISEAMRLGLAHHEAGQLPQAEIYYRAILQAEPAHAGARYHLALIALQSGRAQEAVPALREAVTAQPDNAAHWLNYAVALAAIGEPQKARDVLLQARDRGLGGQALAGLLAQVERMIAAPRPAVVETVDEAGATAARTVNLAPLVRLYGEGRFAEVEAQSRALMAAFPDAVALARLLGESLLAQDKYEAAREAMARAADAFPNEAAIHDLHGLALRYLRRNDEAARAYERSLALSPDRFETLLNASANAVSLGDAEAARRYGERALALRPDDVNALRVLADALAFGGSNEEAAALYQQGIAIDPQAADLHVNLGDVLTNLGRPAEAVAEAERALALRPNHAPAHLTLGRALFRLGETVDARRHFRAASDLAPGMPEAHTAYLFCLAHDETVSPEESFREHLRIGELIEAPLRRFRRPHDNDRDPERALRLGFVSADLRDHAVAYLIEPVWRALRGGPHRLVAYANLRAEDAVSRRLRALVHEWVRVERMDDETLAERIRADRIDVLFDLSGHTVGNRLPVFARKPAPVQVTWMGYPGTTGLSAMDYRFVRDPAGSGPAWQGQFTEKLVRLRQRGFEPEPGAPEVGELPALRNGFVTFASFNRAGKISDRSVSLWSRVLQAVPASRLLIASIEDDRTRDRLRHSFRQHGVGEERLEFRRRAPMAQYLAMHHEVDIVLDTLPYSGGTTTSHALWMGVPVLTLSADTLQQTVSTGILTALGLGDWAVRTSDEYVARAQAAAADLAELARLRQRLRPAMAAAFQQADEAIRLELESVLRTIWRRWCAGLPAEGFAAEP
jgi:predicted O-linked N-acetylglucosamine transferase (SPINDLY family)